MENIIELGGERRKVYSYSDKSMHILIGGIQTFFKNPRFRVRGGQKDIFILCNVSAYPHGRRLEIFSEKTLVQVLEEDMNILEKSTILSLGEVKNAHKKDINQWRIIQLPITLRCIYLYLAYESIPLHNLTILQTLYVNTNFSLRNIPKFELLIYFSKR